MNGITRIAALLLPLAFGGLSLAQQPGRFIPQSPLDEEERATEKQRMKRLPGTSDEQADRMLDDLDYHHAFRDEDIFAAYPELRGRKRLWLCQNSIMGGAAEIAFLVERRKNEATLEKLRCNGVKDGLNCDEPQRGQYYFLDSPDHFFTLDGLTFETAVTIVDTLKSGRLTGLPKWAEPSGLPLNSIKALSEDRFQMIFGDGLCSGCFTKFDVRLDSKGSENRLVLVGEPNAACF